MHTFHYRRIFATIRRALCLSPPNEPLDFKAIAVLTIDQMKRDGLLKCREQTNTMSVYNLVRELWEWNAKRFTRTNCLLLHPQLRRGDARIYEPP